MNNRWRDLPWSVLITAVLVFTQGCTANEEPSKLETKLANMAKQVVIPLEAKNRKNPLPADKETIEQGRELYMQSCAICHGADGRSRTNIGRGMYPPRDGSDLAPRAKMVRRRPLLDYSERHPTDRNAVLEIYHLGRGYLEARALYPGSAPPEFGRRGGGCEQTGRRKI